MKILILAILVVMYASLGNAQTVLMMIPDDFMWPEYSEPRKLYEKAGFKVLTASKYSEPVRPDRRNIGTFPEAGPVPTDLTFDKVKVEDFDAITFVAGNGAWHDFFPNQIVHSIVQKAFDQNRVVGLLCASTGLLGFVNNWDGRGKPVAQGKNVVGYFRVEGILRNLGRVNFIEGGEKEPGAVVDGNLVTGRNPESSKIFAEKVIEVVRSQKETKSK